MRTTLTIDDDVLALARHLADREQKALGEVISSLARLGLQRRAARQPLRNGIPLLPRQPKGAPVTPELVARLRDELP